MKLLFDGDSVGMIFHRFDLLHIFGKQNTEIWQPLDFY